MKYTSGLSEGDISSLKCIPAEAFSLYNDAESNLSNQITLLFEQCGGKYASTVGSLTQDASAGLDSNAFAVDINSSFSSSLAVFDNLFGQIDSLDASFAQS